MAKLITVFGATGSQGGAVAKALLAAGGFKVRAVTRNPNSEKAEELKSIGAEVVKGDMDNADTIKAVVSGAYGVFLVTNYWEHADQDREVRQGKAVADALLNEKELKHVIFSGLEYVKEILGKPCPHFDGKGIVEKYLDEIGLPNTSVRYAYYSENFTNPASRPQKKEDGTYELVYPMDGAMDIVSVEECGAVVASIFSKPDEFIGKKVGLSACKKTLAEYLAIISRVTGKTFKHNQMGFDEFAQLPFPGADDLSAMFEFYSKCNPDRNIELTKRLNPKLSSFEDWAEKNKANFF